MTQLFLLFLLLLLGFSMLLFLLLGLTFLFGARKQPGYSMACALAGIIAGLVPITAYFRAPDGVRLVWVGAAGISGGLVVLLLISAVVVWITKRTPA